MKEADARPTQTQIFVKLLLYDVADLHVAQPQKWCQIANRVFLLLDLDLDLSCVVNCALEFFFCF